MSIFQITKKKERSNLWHVETNLLSVYESLKRPGLLLEHFKKAQVYYDEMKNIRTKIVPLQEKCDRLRPKCETIEITKKMVKESKKLEKSTSEFEKKIREAIVEINNS